MKINQLHFLLLLFCSVILNGCSDAFITTKEIAKEYNNDSLKTGSLRIVISPKVRVFRFEKTFNKLYVNGNNFAKNLTSEIKASLKAEMPNLEINKGEISEYLFFTNKTNTDTSFIHAKINYFKHLTEKYTLLITDIHFSNNFESLGADSLKKFPVGSVEECIISYNLTLIRNIDKKKLFFVEVHGNKGITFFKTEKAMKEAINNNISHLLGFIKDNKVNFKE